jgi:hypothetical protein
MLPPQYDGMSGFKMFSWTDVKGIFELFRIPRKVWDDYYMRLLHFHERFVHYRGEYDKQHPMARATSKAPATAEEAVEQAMLDGK